MTGTPLSRPSTRRSGMGGTHLLRPVGEQQQRRQGLDPAGQPGKDVDRGIVGPVRVLDDQQGGVRPNGQLVPDPIEQFLAVRRPAQRGAQRTGGRIGQVPDGTEGPAGEQVVTGRGQDPGPGFPGRRRGSPDQGGLAGTRLAGDQHHPTLTAAGSSYRCGYCREFGVALDQRSAGVRTHQGRSSHRARAVTNGAGETRGAAGRETSVQCHHPPWT